MTLRSPLRDRGRISGSLATSSRVTRTAPDEAVVHRHHDGDALAEKRMDLEVDDAGRRWSEDPEVVVAAEDAAHHLGGRALLEREPHRGIALEESRQAFGEPAGAHRVEEGDADAAALGGDRALGFGDGVAEVVEDAFGTADEAPAGLRQADVAADPLEELHPDLLFQASDLSGDR